MIGWGDGVVGMCFPLRLKKPKWNEWGCESVPIVIRMEDRVVQGLSDKYVSAVSWSSMNSLVRHSLMAISLLCGMVGAADVAQKVFRMGVGLRINALHRMSDGSILGAGWSRDLDWIPSGVKTVELSATGIDSRDTSGRGVLVRWSEGLDSILWVAAFPAGTTGPLRRIRSSEKPGDPTGLLLVSGDRTVRDPRRDGYFIARIQGHLARSEMPSVVWTFDAICPPRRAGGYRGTSQYKTVQAWDVANDGWVLLARGSEADVDSAEVVRLNIAGKLDLFEQLRSHITAKGRVWNGIPSEFDSRTDLDDTLRYSRLFLKSTSYQGPRSSLRVLVSGGAQVVLDSNFSAVWTTDSAGGLRRGQNPLDILFPGPCREYYHDPGWLFPDSVVCPAGRGWSGLSASSRATARIGGLVVDRRTDRWALGVTWNALSSDGSLLDIPVVSVYQSDGVLLWWSRLRSDADRDTVPNQVLASLAEIQSLSVGQTEHTTGQTLVVQARARDDKAFWSPEEGRLGAGWRRNLAGMSGYGGESSWLGKLTFVNGGFLAATWQAAADSSSGGLPLADAIFQGWPTPGSAGEILSNTSCQARITTDESGMVRTVCRGSRPMATKGAFLSPPPPGAAGAIDWNVLTVWNSGLSQPSWASAFDGGRVAGDAGIGVEIDDHAPSSEGNIVVVGHVVRDSIELPAIDPPSWASEKGDVVLGLLVRPQQVGVNKRNLREQGATLRADGRRLLLDVPGKGPGECCWIDVSGSRSAAIPLAEGGLVLERPSGTGVRFLLVRRGERQWTLGVPLLR